MAGELIITNISGEIQSDNGWEEPEGNFEDYVEIIKITLVAFILENGKAELWPEFVIGNNSSEIIRINSIDIGFKSTDPDPEMALSKFGQKRGENPSKTYIYKERDESWKSQYERYDELQSHREIFTSTDKIGDERDMTYITHLGSGNNSQTVITKPVEFDTRQVMSDDDEPDNIHRFHDFTTLGGSSNHILLPKSDCSNHNIAIENGDEVVDTISFTARWDDSRLTEISDDISFYFRFSINSMIGNIRHCYAYYVPPNDAVLFESTSEYPVVEFFPRDTHWTFKQWQDRYDIARAGSGEMLRSKVKNESYIFNSGIYGFPKRRPISMSLRFVYAVVAGLAASNYISSPTTNNGIILSFILLLLAILTYWTFQPYKITEIREIIF